MKLNFLIKLFLLWSKNIIVIARTLGLVSIFKLNKFTVQDLGMQRECLLVPSHTGL